MADRSQRKPMTDANPQLSPIVSGSSSALALSPTLAQLGWNNHFIQQLSLDEWDDFIPARLVLQHKSQLVLFTENGQITIKHPANLAEKLAVGDWLLLNKEYGFHRLLERISVFSRKAAGSKVNEQLIAANVDTLLIVMSLNHDFNLNRLERYLVLANEAGVEPLVVLTKADLCESQEVIDQHMDDIRALDQFLMVVSLNALDENELSQLSPWCKPGKTLALLGSSGVGKTTLANLLLGKINKEGLGTAAIREDDSKGRHTTISRSLHLIEARENVAGGLLLDTPGMRELQLANSEEGIEETFKDIIEIAQSCKFSDCSHDVTLEVSAGCAVQAAITSGELSERRLLSFQKLQREDALNSASLAEKRHKDKELGKMIKRVQNESRNKKNR